MTSEHGNQKIWTIQQVARKLGRSIHTIGRWQKEGHVTPQYRYDEKNRITRYFSDQDIEIMESVKNQKMQIMISGTGGGIEGDDNNSDKQ